MGKKGCSKIQNSKLNTYDWLCDVPDAANATDYVEVQFKNTRKGYFLNSNKIPLEKGDLVAVEASPGHDIGTVTLTGKLVLLQMKKNNVRTEGVEAKKVYRKAKPTDIEKYEEAKSKEHATMIRSRQIAAELGLNMKIGDVEYQGDGNKAIFYYIADERVDFRQLIKVLAEAFRVRIEMKQIGARQEAGRIGGIGPCGRELCCSSWMTSFVSVATGAARYQDISMNPQKLAGQCAKLKCCINYEVDAYVEAHKRLPSREIVLETKDNSYYHFKTDIFKRELTYSTDKSFAANLVTIPADRAFDVINMNKKGTKPVSLEADTKPQPPKRDAQDILGQDSVTRFDSVKKKKKKKNSAGGTPQANAGENNGGNRNRNNPTNRSNTNEGRPNTNEGRSNENRGNESRMNDSTEGRSNEGRSSEGRSAEGKTTENRPSEGRPKGKGNGGGRPARPRRENREENTPAADNKSGNGNGSASQANGTNSNGTNSNEANPSEANIPNPNNNRGGGRPNPNRPANNRPKPKVKSDNDKQPSNDKPQQPVRSEEKKPEAAPEA